MKYLRLFYIDASGDSRYLTGGRGTTHYVLSALSVPEESWNEVFTELKNFRKYLRRDYGIWLSSEIHAVDFLAGRGNIASRIVPKGQRVYIYGKLLERIAQWHAYNVYVINVSLENKPGMDNFDKGIGRLLTRIQNTLVNNDERGLLIFDEGNDRLVRGVYRRLRIHNPVPSAYGAWDDGRATRNFPTDRILGDPLFRRSDEDYFIQAADCIAYALLKYDEPPTPRIARYGIDRMFPKLEPVLLKRASRKDPYGVVRY